jgi:hypothetical protein
VTTLIRILVLTGLSAMAATAIATAIWPSIGVIVSTALWVQVGGFAAAGLAAAVRYGRARLALRRVVPPAAVPAMPRPEAHGTPQPAPGVDELVESA